MGTRFKSFAGGAVALMLGAVSANADVLHYRAQLKGTSESPPSAGRARGLITVLVDTDRRVMEYTVTYAGLSGPIAVAGFKEESSPPDDPIVTAPVGAGTSSIHAVVQVTDEEMRDLDRGKWLFDISTAANPGGEIRGRLQRVSSF
jgi:hypothetical protein